ncbi:hypothetical protein EV178_003517 [Coemansia sp. RSA 1646]|nr:hypothetical protein EV178_003517 [Coemansia sp. RSA 1646]
MVAASRNPRRYHSIAILTDSTSLLMETGDDFFAPPQARRGLRKHSGNGSRLHRHRQNNEPSGADDASRLLQGGGRFATTNGVFAGGNNGEGVRRADGGGGGGRRVFTLPSLASTSKANIGNHSFISSTHAKDYSASTNAPASSLASTACGSG